MRAVAVAYYEEPTAPTRFFRTRDMSIKVGDYVIIPTHPRHGMTVAQVREVSTMDDPEWVKWRDTEWIIGGVNKADLVSHKIINSISPVSP